MSSSSSSHSPFCSSLGRAGRDPRPLGLLLSLNVLTIAGLREWIRQALGQLNPREVDYPACKPDCLTPEGHHRAGWSYRIANDRCLRAEGDGVNGLDDVIRDGNTSPALDRYASCTTPEDSRLLPQTVDYPACRPSCVLPDGRPRLGWTYRLSENRCLRSTSECPAGQDCLGDIDSGAGNASEHINRFASCEREPDTRYRTQSSRWPECQGNTPSCVTTEGKTRPGWTYTLADGRCLRATTPCTAATCLQDILANGNQSTHLASFASCTEGPDTRLLNATAQYPACVAGSPSCVLPDGRPRVGWRYVYPDGRCVSARAACDPAQPNCLQDIIDHGNNSTLLDGTSPLASCSSGDSRRNSPPNPSAWPDCGSACRDVDGRPFRGWKYNISGDRCLQVTGRCANADCIDDVIRNGNNSALLENDFTFDTCGAGDTRKNTNTVQWPACGAACQDSAGNLLKGWKYQTTDGRCFMPPDKVPASVLTSVAGQPGNPSNAVLDRFLTCSDTVDTRLRPETAAWPACRPRCAFKDRTTHPGWSYTIAGNRCVRPLSPVPTVELDDLNGRTTNPERQVLDRYASCTTPGDTRVLSDTVEYATCDRAVCLGNGTVARAGWSFILPDGRCVKPRTDCTASECIGDIIARGNSSTYLQGMDSCNANGLDTRFLVDAVFFDASAAGISVLVVWDSRDAADNGARRRGRTRDHERPAGTVVGVRYHAGVPDDGRRG